jgi:hypothetical protein
MKAKVGDWLVTKGTRLARPDQRGLITEVRSPDGEPPYVVRWLDSDRVTTVYPGPDSIIITAAEQEESDKRAALRFRSVQSAIDRHTASA